MRSLDAASLGFTDCVFDLRQRLALVEPVENLLRPRFHAESQKVAVRFAHDGKLIHRDGVHPAFAAPLKCQFVVDDILANRADAIPLQQKMVVRQIDRAISLIM